MSSYKMEINQFIKTLLKKFIEKVKPLKPNSYLVYSPQTKARKDKRNTRAAIIQQNEMQ